MLHQPVNHLVDVGWVLAGDHEAAHFPVCDWLQTPAPHRQHTPNKTQFKKTNADSYLVVRTFDRSMLVLTGHWPCQSCSPKPARESRSVMACSTNREVHFWRYWYYQDQQHQQHNCTKMDDINGKINISNKKPISARHNHRRKNVQQFWQIWAVMSGSSHTWQIPLTICDNAVCLFVYFSILVLAQI